MISFKKIGLLETVVLLSAIYVFSTLIWTATTRSAVQEKANLVKSNHETIVNFINNQVNNCDNSGKKEKTLWGDFCDETWSSKKIINSFGIRYSQSKIRINVVSTAFPNRQFQFI